MIIKPYILNQPARRCFSVLQQTRVLCVATLLAGSFSGLAKADTTDTIQTIRVPQANIISLADESPAIIQAPAIETPPKQNIVVIQPEIIPVQGMIGDIAVTSAKVPETQANIAERANANAAARLAALMPQISASDTIPVLDRSAMFSGDLGRAFAQYNMNQPNVQKKFSLGKVQSILKSAMGLMGIPYRWGGSSPETGFDCSGLVGYVFKNTLGIQLPRVSRDMAHLGGGELIRDRNSLTPGDLVFFGRKGGNINHVGIYVGEGNFLHSPSTGKDVRVDTMTTGYWSDKFLQARRISL